MKEFRFESDGGEIVSGTKEYYERDRRVCYKLCNNQFTSLFIRNN